MSEHVSCFWMYYYFFTCFGIVSARADDTRKQSLFVSRCYSPALVAVVLEASEGCFVGTDVLGLAAVSESGKGAIILGKVRRLLVR
jgi:hypothetical protein